MLEFCPKKTPHSANVQAEVYRLLKNNGIDCYLEYYVYDYPYSCKFDLIVVKQKEIKLIIECKSKKIKTKKEIPKNGKQIEKYSQFGVPVWIIHNLNQCQRMTNDIINCINNNLYLENIKHYI